MDVDAQPDPSAWVHGMPNSIQRFDAFVKDFGGTLRVELLRRHGHDKEQLVTFLHPREP